MRVWFVTGASRGIGASIVRAVLAAGGAVVAGARRPGDLQETYRDEEHVLPVQLDVTNEEVAHAAVRRAVDRYGRIDVLVNNAGVSYKGDAWRGPFSTWEWMVGINLYGVIHGIRAFLPIMEDQGEGHIVNTASMAGLVAVPGNAPYGVTKAAVVALSESLFVELKGGGSPVRVSVLCPGFVRTNLVQTQQWSSRLGEEPAPSTSPVQQAVGQLLEQGVAEGIDATIVADEVLDAILEERFWILTHADMRQAPVERMERAARQENPA